MDRIESMGIFAKVVAKQSFSGAARELRLSQAAVSKHVRALEDWRGCNTPRSRWVPSPWSPVPSQRCMWDLGTGLDPDRI